MFVRRRRYDANHFVRIAAVLAAVVALAAPALAQDKKPNILMIMGDDIGWYNPSCYHHGVMGYKTPNIDRIAHEGALFTDWYRPQSCTAGRAAFITGQVGFRTGFLKVGLPGAKEGLQKEDARWRPRSIQSSADPAPISCISRCSSCSLSAIERVRDVHRLGRRCRVPARVCGEELRDSTRARDRLARKDEVRAPRRQARARQSAGNR